MATLHNCRWEWCREAFDKHSDLVDHVKMHMIRGRPMARKRAADLLRTEGYTPEDIAIRLIPGYTPAVVSENNTQPHTPNLSPSIPRTPPPKPVPTKELSQARQYTSLSQSIFNKSSTQPTRSPLQLPSTSPTKTPDKHMEDMPPSSPPPPSPTPASPERTPISRRFGDMSIDEPEPDKTATYSDVLVPISSPPADRQSSGPPSSARRSRLQRRSSFSQMSGSVSPDEYTGARYQPIPESPAITTIIAEREKELKEKEKERENVRVAEKERERRKRELTKAGGPSAPTPSTGLKVLGSRSARGSPPRKAHNPVRGSGLKLRRGRGGLHITSTSSLSTRPEASPQKSQRSTTAARQLARQPSVPVPVQSPFYQNPEPATESQHTVEQLMSEFTHLDSDEELHANLVGHLGDSDLGLQTQAPYAPQTQESYGDSEATASRGNSKGQIPPSGSQPSQARVRG